jgi:alkylmercury lyase
LGLNLAGDGDLPGMVRVEAFRQLLASGSPVAVESLAASIHCSTGTLDAALDELAQAGRIRRDETGRVVGSAGLSVIPDRHRLELDGRTFWTWCAYDILGIFGAQGATGAAFSRSPVTGATITVAFHHGRPKADGVVLFRPSDSYAACCTNIYEEWCPNSNLFENELSAQAWSASRGLEGRILGLEEASMLATGEWLPLFTTGRVTDDRN